MPDSRPVRYSGVMISSTFTDLKEHRAALMSALSANRLHPVAMEDDGARLDDVLASSLEKVRDASAYIGVISSHKYGQIPPSPARNPKGLSLTELEFDEAVRLGRPILIFLMSSKHPVSMEDVEFDPAKRAKLLAFREKVKRTATGVDRVYAEFDSVEDFRVKALKSLPNLRAVLERSESLPPAPEPAAGRGAPIPKPPAFYAEPNYIGSHNFVGRAADLDVLDDWASPANQHPVLLFEAIGGTGKSMLTWHWVTARARGVRDDWAGVFWYSFYEKNAIMADFCQRALAYVTERPLEDFAKKKTPELAEDLLHHLKARPWLFVLDGLERVLVAYHRYDAAQLSDEEAGGGDAIADRDPCSSIRPEDDDMLRSLAGAGPSKLLLTTRLTPRILLNASRQAIPGVLRRELPGLRPADAEALFRSCGIRGDSLAIQRYLQENCDCHPLVTGVLAGIVNDYLPDRENFDAWLAGPDGAARLNLGALDLVQKRNHILNAALNALSLPSREVLSVLALLSDAVGYTTLRSVRPGAGLDAAILDLERRGLVQYDGNSRTYDLHPVVRAVAAHRLGREETERIGQRVVDFFSERVPGAAEAKRVQTLEDLHDEIQVVRALLKMGRMDEAAGAYARHLSIPLDRNIGAFPIILELLRPLFPEGWTELPAVEGHRAGLLSTDAGIALGQTGSYDQAFAAYVTCLRLQLDARDNHRVCATVGNLGLVDQDRGKLAASQRLLSYGLRLAELAGGLGQLFKARLSAYGGASLRGDWREADRLWSLLSRMGRSWPVEIYSPGDAEFTHAVALFRRCLPFDAPLSAAEQEARRAGAKAPGIHYLRALAFAEKGNWDHVSVPMRNALRMARESGIPAEHEETFLALAKYHLGQLPSPHEEATRLASLRNPAHRPLAELWLAIGDTLQAKKHALLAYTEAWADGEPYVHRYELDRTRELLERMGEPIPDLPAYDPAKDPPYPWEAEVDAYIAELERKKLTPP